MGFLRLRQICLVAPTLEPAVSDLANVLGLEICHRDPAVGKYGLENALLPVGTDFLEVVAPLKAGTAAERYLERRGGAGGYMVILDCDDPEPWRRHAGEIGVRIANPIVHDRYIGLQLHPRDTGGAMLEINYTAGGGDLLGPYNPAGPKWQTFVRTETTRRMVAAVVQCDDPETLARRWAKILKREASRNEEGWGFALDQGRIGFVEARDGRGEGLGQIDLEVADPAGIKARAKARGLAVTGEIVMLCGTRFRLS